MSDEYEDIVKESEFKTLVDASTKDMFYKVLRSAFNAGWGARAKYAVGKPENVTLWRNKKTGHFYRRAYIAIDTTNARDGNELVIYSPTDDPLTVYARDLPEFLEKFEQI